MVIDRLYYRYKLRKKRGKLLNKASSYLLPEINTLLALKQLSCIYLEICGIDEELKKNADK